MAKNDYYKPIFTTIRLEAVWNVRVGFSRGSSKVIADLLKKVNTVIKCSYLPSCIRPSRPGHMLELASLSIEEALDRPDMPFYPDW